jgi:adenylate kinase family enzyme
VKYPSIILVFGKICSGKGTYCKQVIADNDTLRFNHITTSDVVREISSLKARSELQHTANLDVVIASNMCDKISNNSNNGLVTIIDGIRQTQIKDAIADFAAKNNLSVRYVWLEVPSAIRLIRFLKRQRDIDDQSFEEAQQGDELLGISELYDSIFGKDAGLNLTKIPNYSDDEYAYAQQNLGEITHG